MQRTKALNSKNGYYVDYNRRTRDPSTNLEAADRNALQEEIVQTIEAAGLTPAPLDPLADPPQAQLPLAVSALVGSHEFSSLLMDTTGPVDPNLLEGVLAWNAQAHTLDIGLGNGVILQAGQELHFPEVVNRTGSTIPNGTPVQYVGFDAPLQKKSVAPFLASSPHVPHNYLGVTTEDILNNTVGRITYFGVVRDIDTSNTSLLKAAVSPAWSVGDFLYVSETEAGKYTTTAPSSPNHTIVAGIIVSQDATVGQLFVRSIIYPEARDVMYDNTGTTLAATNVQAALTELDAAVQAVGGVTPEQVTQSSIIYAIALG